MQLTSRRIFGRRFIVPGRGLHYPVSSREEVYTRAKKKNGRNLNFEYRAIDRCKTGVTYDPEVECVCWSAPGIPKPGPHWPWQIRYSSLLNRQVNCRTRTIFFSGSLFHSFFTPAVLYWIVNKLMKQTAMHNSCFPLNSCVLNCKVWKKLYSEHCDLLWIPAVSHIAVW